MSPRTRTPRRLGLGLGLVLALGLAACDSGGDIGNTGGFPGEGDAYPDAALQTCDGGATSIESIIAAHDVTYITYAATWCTACQKEAPLLNTDLVDGFDPAKVAVVQILIEDQPGDPPPVSLCAAWRDDLNARYTVLVAAYREDRTPPYDTARALMDVAILEAVDRSIKAGVRVEISRD